MRALALLLILAGAGRITAQSQLAKEMVEAHNKVRQTVQAPNVAWSDTLANAAQGWANHLIDRRDFQHDPKSKYGQNLFEMRNAASKPDEVVKRWADEAKNYDHKSNKCHGACGHYTQLVWSRTREIGCAVARGPGREVWVCNYNPPGNYVGQRPY